MKPRTHYVTIEEGSRTSRPKDRKITLRRRQWPAKVFHPAKVQRAVALALQVKRAREAAANSDKGRQQANRANSQARDRRIQERAAAKAAA